jgi:hypothetical protein
MEDDLNFWKSKTINKFLKIEENLIFLGNGRQPQFFLMEEDLKYYVNEIFENERRPQFLSIK